MIPSLVSRKAQKDYQSFSTGVMGRWFRIIDRIWRARLQNTFRIWWKRREPYRPFLLRKYLITKRFPESSQINRLQLKPSLQRNRYVSWILHLPHSVYSNTKRLQRNCTISSLRRELLSLLQRRAETLMNMRLKKEMRALSLVKNRQYFRIGTLAPACLTIITIYSAEHIRTKLKRKN